MQQLINLSRRREMKQIIIVINASCYADDMPEPFLLSARDSIPDR